ncbi:MAG: DNA-3-methyladenine glycosylase [Eubacteriales bacterium]
MCSALELSEKLLGKTLVHTVDGVKIGGVITETEAYMGVSDKASHAYGGRRTARTETMYLEGGCAYVYLIYGMYSCMNITANECGIPEAVLIRAVYPVFGEDKLYELVKKHSRRRNLPDSIEGMTEKEKYALTDGPGKLCIALGISRELDRCDMVGSGEFFVQDDGIKPKNVVRSKRIGIGYAGEAADYLWRFSAGTVAGVPEFAKY